LFLFFLALTLKSRRYVEYYVPFAVLNSAKIISGYLKEKSLKKYFQQFYQLFIKKILLISALGTYLLFTLSYIVMRDIAQVYQSLRQGSHFYNLAPSAQWLAHNSPKDSIVFHSDWDEFPILFYHNDHNYYIVGLDPTFMYNYNQELYWQWVNITLGVTSSQLHHIIKDNFKASFVYLTKDHQAMDNNLQNDSLFRLIYEDEEAKIYKVL
jgi:hypothetical protein